MPSSCPRRRPESAAPSPRSSAATAGTRPRPRPCWSRPLVAWLGPDAVTPIGFYANGTGPVEVVARVGQYYITGHGIENEDDLTVNCCQRHRARFSQSRLEDLDLTVPNTRFTMGSPLAQRAAERLGVLLAEEIDPEIARVVLGA